MKRLKFASDETFDEYDFLDDNDGEPEVSKNEKVSTPQIDLTNNISPTHCGFKYLLFIKIMCLLLGNVMPLARFPKMLCGQVVRALCLSTMASHRCECLSHCGRKILLVRKSKQLLTVTLSYKNVLLEPVEVTRADSFE